MSSYQLQQNRGYSIVEVLVAITVLLIAIVGPLTIASKGLQNAQLAREQNIASFLAQEGIEHIHNLRNTAALNHFNNPTGVPDPWAWSSVATTCASGGDGCSATVGTNGVVALAACSSKEACRLNLHTSGRTLYRINPGGTETGFIRQIFIDNINADQVNIRSVVSWESTIATSERTVELGAVLTNLYQP